MAHPERVLLSSIKTLVLYADEFTKSRRTSPVPQLECTGSVCRDFQPPSVYCTKAGDSDWKCEADLPASLRFGKLHVSCEGWDRPGDPYVLKGISQRLITSRFYRFVASRIVWPRLLPRAHPFWKLSCIEGQHRLYLRPIHSSRFAGTLHIIHLVAPSFTQL
ncbi:hypothetical protein B0J17DRAFT_256316 [Rhizoctonia solani]|nr:hypothetical protein B0J17DRAFT_256316 [Rhizoctonia solani]